MILYHGSNVEVGYPDVMHSRADVDFGRGFYATSLKDQAIRWSERFKRGGGKGIVSTYDCNELRLASLDVKRFDCYDEEWLDFIMVCRRGEDRSDYDVVIGGVANDRVFNTVELFFDELIDKTEAIKRLRFEKPNQQICFRNQESIDLCLKFEGSFTV